MTPPALFQDKEGYLDLSSILGVMAFLAFLLLSWHSYIELRAAFDPQGWGIGAGGLAFGHGAGRWASNKADYS